MIAKLLVAAGAFDQASGGDTFWPGQGGLVRLGSEPANLAGHTSPSLNAGEVTANGSAAGPITAGPLAKAAAQPRAGRHRPSNRTRLFSLFGFVHDITRMRCLGSTQKERVNRPQADTGKLRPSPILCGTYKEPGCSTSNSSAAITTCRNQARDVFRLPSCGGPRHARRLF